MSSLEGNNINAFRLKTVLISDEVLLFTQKSAFITYKKFWKKLIQIEHLSHFKAEMTAE